MKSASKHVIQTPLGSWSIEYSDLGITRIRLLEKSVPSSKLSKDIPRFVIQVARALERHLGGSPQDLSFARLDMTGIPAFHKKAYEAARQLKSGETSSYGEIAKRAGSPGASRAVGQAMARNPFTVIVPCHRVLASGSKVGGFTAVGGLSTKRKMLAIEGVMLGVKPPKLPFDEKAARRFLKKADPILGKIIDRVGPYTIRLEPTVSVFEALSRSIIYQQLSGKAAATIHARYRLLFSDGRTSAEGTIDFEIPRLRSVGLSENKAKALLDLAAKTISGDVPSLKQLAKMNDEEIIELLTKVRGIGRWTVQMMLMFRLGRPDVLPIDDLGVRKGFQKIYDLPEMPSPKELTAFAKRWAPYRSVASWYMWRALELA